MRPIKLTVPAALLALAVGGAAAGADSPEPSAQASAPAKVAMGDNVFNPTSIRVKPQTTLTWTNNGQNPHNATAASGAFKTADLNPGQSASFTFKKLGKFPYSCTIHPGMRGTVKVCKKVDGKLVCTKPK